MLIRPIVLYSWLKIFKAFFHDSYGHPMETRQPVSIMHVPSKLQCTLVRIRFIHVVFLSFLLDLDCLTCR